MKRKVVIRSTLAAAQFIANKIHQWHQNNVPGYNATKWADPVKHPVRSEWSVPVKARILAALSQAEQALVQDQPDDWETKQHP